jgi:hypothetical protein
MHVEHTASPHTQKGQKAFSRVLRLAKVFAMHVDAGKVLLSIIHHSGNVLCFAVFFTGRGGQLDGLDALS